MADYDDQVQDNLKVKKRTKEKIRKVEAGQNMISQKLASFWNDQIEEYDQSRSSFFKRGNTILKRYRDQRSRIDEEGQRRMNVLWTNIQIMKPAIYSKCPTPIAERKFLDKDIKGRLGAMILERGLRNEVSLNGVHSSFNCAVLDYLLPGRGQIWCRYEPSFGQGESLSSTPPTQMEDELYDIYDEEGYEENEDESTEELEETGNQVIAEKAMVDYINWHDFFEFPHTARTWSEVQAVGKRVMMSKEECIEFFGEEIGSKMRTMTQLNNKNNAYADTSLMDDMNDRNIEVFEIWNKTDKRVYWISTGYDYLCKIIDDPLGLEGFFPCPKPIYSNATNDTLIPIADYMQWQDQAIQIDELTMRVAMLTKACKIAGTYDASNGALKRLFNESVENELIPVDSWAAYAEKGGVQGGISLLPIDEIQKVIETLTTVRREVKQDLDEVTGLSDVLRGTTDSRETLGGLRIKNNNAGSRLSDRQNQVAEFTRETISILAQIIAKHFSLKTLVEISGIVYEEELDPDNILRDLMCSDEVQKMLSAPPPQMPMQQPQLPPPGMGQPPPVSPPTGQMSQAGGPPGMPSPMQPPSPPSPEQIEDQLKQVIPDIIEKKIEDSVELLRKDVPRRYRIDIETDSTIFADAMQERQDSTEFITSVTQFLTQAMQVGGSMPKAIPLFGKLLQFGIRKFRTGRDLESAVETFVKQSEQQAKEMERNPQKSPEQEKHEYEMEKLKATSDLQQKNDERDFQKQQQEDSRTAQIQAADDQRKMQLEMAKSERQKELDILTYQIEKAKLANELHAAQLDQQYKQAEHERKMEELKMKDNMSDKKEAARKAKVKNG